MRYPLELILEKSNLPSPRANLELLYAFIENASEEEIASCLNVEYKEKNTPEEFALMCGIAARIHQDAKKCQKVVVDLRPFANHESWRVREGICFGFQKSKGLLTAEQMKQDLKILKNGSPLELRTYIATLSEPALLNGYIDPNELLEEMIQMTIDAFNSTDKLSEDLKVLRKALGYCFSVALCGEGADKSKFEKLFEHAENKYIKWIIQENLKKKRLENMTFNFS